jgi:hypothetical protein
MWMPEGMTMINNIGDICTTFFIWSYRFSILSIFILSTRTLNKNKVSAVFILIGLCSLLIAICLDTYSWYGMVNNRYFLSTYITFSNVYKTFYILGNVISAIATVFYFKKELTR